jgi:uncharacterized protein YndB with AHSA1/START domain
MRMLRRIVLAVAAIVVLAVGVAYLLPQRVAVARSIDIAGSPEVVFPLIGDLRMARKWSPWLSIDPNVRVTFGGAEIGVGQTMSWSSGDARVGAGSQTVTEYEPNSRVVTALDFGPQGRAVAIATIESTAEGSRVTWRFEADLGMNPVARFFGPALESMIAPDYERGLAMLKEAVETEVAAAVPKPAAVVPADPEVSAPVEPAVPADVSGETASDEPVSP